MPAALVTDSTAYLPSELVERFAVTVVPLQVLIAGKAFDENEIAPGELASALRSRTPVTTSRPSPAMFAAAYDRLVAEGYDAVVSVHLSAEMSGTAAAARLAATDVAVPVEVVDSRSLGMGLGYAVVAAGQALASDEDATRGRDGRPGSRRQLLDRSSTSTLSSTCAGAAGSEPRPPPSGPRWPSSRSSAWTTGASCRWRTSERRPGRSPAWRRWLWPRCRPAVGWTWPCTTWMPPSRLSELAERLAARAGQIGEVGQLVVAEVGAVVGAHVGPGMLAVVVSPVPSPAASTPVLRVQV